MLKILEDFEEILRQNTEKLKNIENVFVKFELLF